VTRQWRLGFGAISHRIGLFIGVLDPTHRGDRVLQFLSSNRTQIRLHLKDIVKGVIHGLVTVQECTVDRVGGNPIRLTGLAWALSQLQLGVGLVILAGLAWLALSGSGIELLVGLAPG
jgi:hypothetical protein